MSCCFLLPVRISYDSGHILPVPARGSPGRCHNSDCGRVCRRHSSVPPRGWSEWLGTSPQVFVVSGLQYCRGVWLPQDNLRLPLNYKGEKASSKTHLWGQHLDSGEIFQDYSVSLKFPPLERLLALRHKEFLQMRAECCKNTKAVGCDLTDCSLAIVVIFPAFLYRNSKVQSPNRKRGKIGFAHFQVPLNGSCAWWQRLSIVQEVTYYAAANIVVLALQCRNATL